MTGALPVKEVDAHKHPLQYGRKLETSNSAMSFRGIRGSNQETIKVVSICKVENTVELQWLEHRQLVYRGNFKLVLESLGNIP